MTIEQINKWRAHRDIAKKIEDPVERQAALDKLYEEKDDLMQECFQKQSQRIKNVMYNQEQLKIEVNELNTELKTSTHCIKDSISDIQRNVANISEIIVPMQSLSKKYKESLAERRGAIKLLMAFKYIIAAGGGVVLIKLIQFISQHL